MELNQSGSSERLAWILLASVVLSRLPNTKPTGSRRSNCFPFHPGNFYTLKMLLDRNTNKCFYKDTAKHLDKYQNNCINKSNYNAFKLFKTRTF